MEGWGGGGTERAQVESALGRIGVVSRSNIADHRDAIAWRDSVPTPPGLVWLPNGWATSPEQADLWEYVLSRRVRERIERALRQPVRGRQLRASYAATERFALPV